MKVEVTYFEPDAPTEIVEVPLRRKFQDLRTYFKGPTGHPAEAVVILDR